MKITRSICIVTFIMIGAAVGPISRTAAQDSGDLVPQAGIWTYSALHSTYDCTWGSGESTLDDYAEDVSFSIRVFGLYAG